MKERFAASKLLRRLNLPMTNGAEGYIRSLPEGTDLEVVRTIVDDFSSFVGEGSNVSVDVKYVPEEDILYVGAGRVGLPRAIQNGRDGIFFVRALRLDRPSILEVHSFRGRDFGKTLNSWKYAIGRLNKSVGAV